MVAYNFLSDNTVEQLFKTCLSVVAPHVDYQHCCEAGQNWSCK